MEEALDRALDIGRGLSRTDDYVRLLFAELREQRLRDGLANMIDRRLVVEDALERALASRSARSDGRTRMRARVRAAARHLCRAHRRRRRVSRQRAGSSPALGDLLGRHAAGRGRRPCRRPAWRAASSTASRTISSTRRSSRASGSTGYSAEGLHVGGRRGRSTGTTCSALAREVAERPEGVQARSQCRACREASGASTRSPSANIARRSTRTACSIFRRRSRRR